jgi:MoxR-like ATPase
VLRLQATVREVAVEDSIYDYLLDLVHATRQCAELHVGVSTRGALSLYRAAQALAVIEGRDFVVPDDIKRLAVPTLAHRVISKGYMHGNQREAVEAIVRRLVESTPAPD